MMWIFCLIFTVMVTAGAATLASRSGFHGAPLHAALVSLCMYAFIYFAFYFTPLLASVRRVLKRQPKMIWAMVGFLLIPYIIYGVGTGTFQPALFLKVALYIGLPLCLLPRAPANVPTLRDFIAIGLLWVPFNLGILEDAWPWPKGQGGYILCTLLAVNAALILFGGWRQFERIGFWFDLTVRDLVTVLIHFVLFLVVALPLGFAIHFITWKAQIANLSAFSLQFLAIFIFIALPEELLFRGLLQNFLNRRMKSQQALVVSALLFGLAHIHHQPFPNWRFCLMAAIAGIFYGNVYQKTRGLAAPALLHAAVDAAWSSFFHF